MSLAQLKSADIAVLLGGSSAEREVSLQSGRTVSDALQARGYRVRDVDPAEPDWIEALHGVAPDHPHRIELPESQYLKCAFVRLDGERPGAAS